MANTDLETVKIIMKNIKSSIVYTFWLGCLLSLSVASIVVAYYSSDDCMNKYDGIIFPYRKWLYVYGYVNMSVIVFCLILILIAIYRDVKTLLFIPCVLLGINHVFN